MLKGLIPLLHTNMRMRDRHFFINILMVLSCFSLNYLAISYCFTDWDIAVLESKKLEELYASLQMNSLLMQKISNIDVSYLMSQYDIARIRVRFGFNYETAKTLYQYHQYHNIRVGSTNVLVEYVNLMTEIEPPQYEKFKKWSDLSLYQQQQLQIGFMIFCGYWLVILLGSCIILKPKK